MSGSKRTSIAKTGGSNDHIEEMIPPTLSWGKYFITAPFAKRTGGDIIRILVSADNTEVQLSSTLHKSNRTEKLRLGRFKQLDVPSTDFYYISASDPILVVQYSKTGSVDRKASDPFMILVIPIEQFSKDYTFATPEAVEAPYQNFVAIICKTVECDELSLDGSPITGANFWKTWTLIHGPQASFSVGIVLISHGTHTLSHPDPTAVYGIQVYGQVRYESYGFPGGMLISPLYSACVPTSVVVNDGFDNDCDGKIDEELVDSLDNDGDGNIDEDTAQQPNPLFLAFTRTTASLLSSTVNRTKRALTTCTQPSITYTPYIRNGSNYSADNGFASSTVVGTVVPGVILLLVTPFACRCCCLLAALKRRRRREKKKESSEANGEEEVRNGDDQHTKTVQKTPVVPIYIPSRGQFGQDDWLYSRDSSSQPRTEKSVLTTPGTLLNI